LPNHWRAKKRRQANENSGRFLFLRFGRKIIRVKTKPALGMMLFVNGRLTKIDRRMHFAGSMNCRKVKKTNRSGLCQEVADAVVDLYPDRALTIYLERAEHEMEATRDYPAGIRQLNKAKKALEKTGRSSEWSKIMEDIRVRHRRKSSLMKQLAEFECGSIVKQKRR